METGGAKGGSLALIGLQRLGTREREREREREEGKKKEKQREGRFDGDRNTEVNIEAERRGGEEAKQRKTENRLAARHS